MLKGISRQPNLKAKKHFDAVEGSAYDEIYSSKMSREDRKLQYYLKLFAQDEDKQTKKEEKQTRKEQKTKEKQANHKRTYRQAFQQEKDSSHDVKIELITDDDSLYECFTQPKQSWRLIESEKLCAIVDYESN